MIDPIVAVSGEARRPRVGFLGTGWIGRHRLEAIAATGAVDIVGFADISPENCAAAAVLAPGAASGATLDDLLALDLDGLVIATPSALHAEQAIMALARGVAVFCQKPLGRDAGEVAAVVAAARIADRLLGVDLSYRSTAGMQQIRALLDAGALGRIFAVDLVFHNAYGPDKPWFYNPALSGGGCVIDLGVHLVDLALWALDFPEVVAVTSDLSVHGRPLTDHHVEVEDYAVATIRLATGTTIRLACSWHLHAGCDAIISASFFGTEGGAAMQNVGGSFYDFASDRFSGTTRSPLGGQSDDWGGRAAAAWAMGLADGARFDPAADRYIDVAGVLDLIYGADRVALLQDRHDRPRGAA